MAISFYEFIMQHLVNGELPEDVSLPVDDENSAGMHVMDGAIDGIYLFHMEAQEPTEQMRRDVEITIRTIAADNTQESVEALKMLGIQYGAINCMDTMQQYIVEHSSELDASIIANFAVDTVLHGTDKESVKLALGLLMFFTIPEDSPMRDVIRVMGCSDEFTLHVLPLVSHWENPNDEIFAIAKKTHGWGRIVSVSVLNAETNEIRDWFLTEGWKNQIAPGYSALACFDKGDAERMIRKPMDEEMFAALSGLTAALLEDQPLPGISAVEDADKYLDDFLAQCDNFAMTPQILETVRMIRNVVDNEELQGYANDILTRESSKAVVSEALKNGEAIDLAIEMGIPYAFELEKFVQKDPMEHAFAAGYLLKAPEYSERTLELYRHILPLQEMTGEPTNELLLVDEKHPGCAEVLHTLLESLITCPGFGSDLVTVGLGAPAVYNRSAALQVCMAWVQAAGKPLKEMSDKLYDVVMQAYAKEVNGDLKGIMEKILEGVTDFRALYAEDDCDCGCGCGHDHDHNHEHCSCGHDHNHEHDSCGCGHEHHSHDHDESDCSCGCGCGHDEHHGHEHHDHEHHEHDSHCGCGCGCGCGDEV